ncbi:MAG: hypothetical protein JJU00_14585 [Opitutales bacterium]|nr:hypothetical protein [Opitutales bacterium]
MSTDAPDFFALEVASTGIAAGTADTAVTSEPAAARLDGEAIVAGWAAYAAEAPAPVWYDFWEHLSRDPLPESGADRILARSILAYHHLGQTLAALGTDLSSASCAVALAPSILDDDERTGLFLSMAKSHGLRLRGLLPLPLALAAGVPGAVPPEGSFGVLDLDSGQWTLFSMHREDSTLRAGTVTTTREGRLKVLRGHFFDALAARFLAETAFDVRHSADAEALFRLAVDRFLAADPGEGEYTLGFATRKARSITVSRAAARELAADLPKRVVAALGLDDPREHTPLLLSHRAHFLPGLAETLAAEGRRPVLLLPAEAAVLGALRAAAEHPVAESIEATPELREITLLPSGGESPPTTARSRPPAREIPTHVLWRGLVYPLGHSALPPDLLVHDGKLRRADGVRVNGNAAETFQPLEPGDRVETGEESFLLTRMAPS